MDHVSSVLARFAPPPGTYPWQDTDPYGTLIAELLLARTRREVIVRVYPPLIDRWPDAFRLATAEPDDVWSVIAESGFRGRAERLVRLGATISDEFDGQVPQSRQDLLSLPGVGPYAADAVRVFSFSSGMMPLDRNTSRLASRLLGLAEDASSSSPYADADLVKRSSDLLAGTPSMDRAIFRGMLEISADFCRPRPRCDVCPLASSCASAQVLYPDRPSPISSA